MNWNAVAAIAQVIASVGLFLSIIYLAVQVRQGTVLARITAEQAAVTTFRDVILPIAKDKELDRIWRIGLSDFSQLDPDDQSRFFHIAFQALKGAEAVHSSYLDRVMDEDTWQGWKTMFTYYLSAPGLRSYWSIRRGVFAGRFNEFVETVPAPRSDIPVAGLHAPYGTHVATKPSGAFRDEAG